MQNQRNEMYKQPDTKPRKIPHARMPESSALNVAPMLDKQIVKSKEPKVLNIPFEEFWDLYDKKVDRPRCEKLWRRLTNKERVAAMEYLPGYIESTPDKKFRKNPFTFLNNESWENELISKPVIKPVYSDLLNDPRWQRKRLEIMQRDDFKYQMCGDTLTELQVHHKIYGTGRQPWEYDAKELITLCINCHKKLTSIQL